MVAHQQQDLCQPWHRVWHNQHVLPKGQGSPYTMVHSTWSRLGSGQSLLVECVLVVDGLIVLEFGVVVLVVVFVFDFVALLVLRHCCPFCSPIATALGLD